MKCRGKYIFNRVDAVIVFCFYVAEKIVCSIKEFHFSLHSIRVFHKKLKFLKTKFRFPENCIFGILWGNLKCHVSFSWIPHYVIGLHHVHGELNLMQVVYHLEHIDFIRSNRSPILHSYGLVFGSTTMYISIEIEVDERKFLLI